MTFGQSGMKILYKGTVSSDGNSIEFTRTMEGGGGGRGSENREGGRGGASRTFTAKRATS